MDEANRKLSWAVGKKTVLCVGVTMMDCITFVRRFPKLDEPERSLKGYWQRGGYAGYNCTVLRNLGVDVEFFGVMSSSPLFRILETDMRQRDIKMDNCPRCPDDPPFTTVINDRAHRTCTIIKCRRFFPYPTPEDFEKLDLRKYGWIHFSGRRAELTIPMMRYVLEFNAPRAEKIVISMDMDTELADNWPLVNYCDYVFFYRQLAEENGWKTLQEACLNIEQQLCTRFGINLKRPYVVFLWNLMKVGLMDCNSNFSQLLGYKHKRFVESLGATEVFVSSFIYAIYIRQRSHEDAAEFASQMASFKCTKRGLHHIINCLLPPVL